MGKQITASNTALFLQCQRPFDPDTPIDPDDRDKSAADYGTKLHKALEERIQGRPYHCPDESFHQHSAEALERLKSWMAKSPWGSLEVEAAEIPYATRIVTPKKIVSRICDFDESTHTYALREKEFGGTFDLLLRTRKGKRVVLDIKTGLHGEFSDPSLVPQMRTLALQTGAVGVAVLHTPQGLPPVVYANDINSKELADHAGKLHLQMSRVGDGSLRPGPECKYCPAASSCPAKQGEVLAATGALVKASGQAITRGRISRGELHLLLSNIDNLKSRVMAELKEQVRDGALIERPDGKVLELVKFDRESLSKSSVVRALGKLEGEKVLDMLREKGCIETFEVEQLRAK